MNSYTQDIEKVDGNNCYDVNNISSTTPSTALHTTAIIYDSHKADKNNGSNDKKDESVDTTNTTCHCTTFSEEDEVLTSSPLSSSRAAIGIQSRRKSNVERIMDSKLSCCESFATSFTLQLRTQELGSELSSTTVSDETQMKQITSENKSLRDKVSSLMKQNEKLQQTKVNLEEMVMEKNKDSAATNINDELVVKLGDLAEENGGLLSRCERLECELKIAKSKTANCNILLAASNITEADLVSDSVQQIECESWGVLFSRGLKETQELMTRLLQSLDSNMAADMTFNDILTYKEITKGHQTLNNSVKDAIKLVKQRNESHKRTVATLNMELERKERSNKTLELKEDEDELARNIAASKGWEREKEEISTTLSSLKRENENLRTSMKDMITLMKTAEDCTERVKEEYTSLKRGFEMQKEMNQSLKAEVKRAMFDREMRETLQKEIDLLRQSVPDSKECTEPQANSENAKALKEKVDALVDANDQLKAQVKLKNEALEGVKSILQTLKEDQDTVKKTIIALREENSRLKNSSISNHYPPPRGRSKTLCPKESRPKSRSKSRSLTRKQAVNESYIRELRCALSNETEKANTLQIANDELAARICKLVNFIQESAMSKQKQTQSSCNSKNSRNGSITPLPNDVIRKQNDSTPAKKNFFRRHP